MPWAIAAAAVVGAGASIYAADKASSAQTKAANQAQTTEQKALEQIRGDLAPYREAGNTGLNYYQDFLGVNGPAASASARNMFQTSPGYDFAVNEGQKAIEGSAAARGGLLSGGTLKALQDRRMGVANQEYGSYLDRFLGLSSLGENAAAQSGNFTAGSAARQGQYINDAGAAQAGGYLSAAQGVNGAINNSLSLYGYGKGQGWFGNSGGGSGYYLPGGEPRGYYVRA